MSNIPAWAGASPICIGGASAVFHSPYDALIGANVAPEKAKAAVEAFEKERETMTSTLATKQDLLVLESRMTIKLGAMLVAAVGLIVTLIKVL
ncbi:hypothetical protein RA210_U10397 [Rubrivivax sp. A210]|uniref:hypothetical protein n=1 Tax=Rubrivivax sp. A210 TaxID=2772301 RepID=UPI0019197469|nr:hypothetical protein [Rubrivivax sp. A210]CAD5366582.1 hypothetical protein RA210_U10397 [Rubrivivax sp. A210]